MAATAALLLLLGPAAARAELDLPNITMDVTVQGHLIVDGYGTGCNTCQVSDCGACGSTSTCGTCTVTDCGLCGAASCNTCQVTDCTLCGKDKGKCLTCTVTDCGACGGTCNTCQVTNCGACGSVPACNTCTVTDCALCGGSDGCGATHPWPRDPMVPCGFKWTKGAVGPADGSGNATIRGLLTIRGGAQFGGTCTAGGYCWETNFCDGGACCRNSRAFDDPLFDPYADPCPGGCDSCRPDSASAVVGVLEDTDGQCIPRPAGYECRAVADLCDVKEICPGSWTATSPINRSDCPVDAFKPAATVCRTVAGPCDLEDTCTGLSAACVDHFRARFTTCRASTGGCDPAEVCSGTAASCPANVYAAAGTVCDWSGAACAGGAPACPMNTMPAGTQLIKNMCGL